MVAVHKLAQVLLMPEVWLIAWLIGAWVVARSAKRWLLARWLWLCALVVFYGLQIGPTKDILLQPLELYYPPMSGPVLPSQDAVIVLAGSVEGQPVTNTPTLSGTSTLPRLICGITRWRNGEAPLLVMSGGPQAASGPQPLGADVMQTLAVQLGVPASAIMTEARSRTTAESAVEVRRLFAGLQRVILVTSALHLPRATAVFRKEGFEVTPAPCDYLSDAGEVEAKDFLPKATRLANIGLAIHEYVGLAVYRLFGRL
jgi:uncharacterized SAM-binding protein YcdF (DUF218 family)